MSPRLHAAAGCEVARVEHHGVAPPRDARHRVVLLGVHAELERAGRRAVAVPQEPGEPGAGGDAGHAERVGALGEQRARGRGIEVGLVILDEVGACPAAGQAQHRERRLPARGHRHVASRPALEADLHCACQGEVVAVDAAAKSALECGSMPLRIVEPQRAAVAAASPARASPGRSSLPAAAHAERRHDPGQLQRFARRRRRERARRAARCHR